MKSKLVIISICASILITQSLNANPVVVPGKLSSEMCGKVWSFRNTEIEIGIFNSDTLIGDIQLIFEVNSPDSTPIQGLGIRYLNGFDTLFVSVAHEVLIEDGVIKYVMRAVGFLPGKGLPVTPDTVSYLALEFQAGSLFNDRFTICFDSSTTSVPSAWREHGNWSVSSGPSLQWSGPVCYQIFYPSPLVPVFNFCPTTITGDSYCDNYSFDFDATDAESDPIVFELRSGPGQINPITGLWSFVPTIADAGQSYSLIVATGENYCGDSAPERLGVTCEVNVSVGSLPPPQFQAGQNAIFVATSGDTLPVTFAIDNPGSCTPHQYAYYIEPGDPQPTGYIDALSGTFFYTGTAGDTGTYKINLVLSAGSIADTNSFFIYHYDDKACGDMDHSGSVDIADLTWLINFLFIDFFPPPLPLSSGNVDCAGGVDIADLTMLIDHLFINFPPLCPDC